MLGLVLAGILLLLAVPRTMAAWEAVSAYPALTKFVKANPVELREGIAGLARASHWVDSSLYLTELGTLELLLIESLPAGDAQRGALVQSAERHLMAGLAVNPFDGLNWYRLAAVRTARSADGRTIADALMKSLDLAPNMRGLWLDRTVALLRLRKSLTPDETAALQSQIRRIWHVDAEFRSRLVQVVRPDAGALEALRQTLGADAEAQEQLKQPK